MEDLPIDIIIDNKHEEKPEEKTASLIYFMIVSDSEDSINRLWRNLLYYFVESSGLFDDPIRIFDLANEKVLKINELNNVIIDIKKWRKFKLMNMKILRDEKKILFSSTENIEEIKKLFSCGLYCYSYTGKYEIGFYDSVKDKLLTEQDDFSINDKRHYGGWRFL